MRNPVLPVVVVLVTVAGVHAQSRFEVHNFRGVISTATHPVTGANYPWSPTTPPGYTGAGVAAGTRCWISIPERRFKGGHRAPNFLTLSGMSQTVFVGAGTTDFTQHYQFATGVAPARTVAAPHGFEHATTGADVVAFPSAPLAVTNITNFRHSFTLATPVPLPEIPLVLFVEFRGGEQIDHTSRGQTLQADWQGGTSSSAQGIHYGFTTGPQTGRSVTLTGDPVFRGQIGMLVDEPIFTATGYHGNLYYGALANELFLGIGAMTANYHINPSSNLFFNFSAGPAFGNGAATVLFNYGQAQFPSRITTSVGNLMLSPVDPLFTAFADAGVSISLDAFGNADGSLVPYIVPVLGVSALGFVFDFQGIVLDPVSGTIRVTNRSSTRIG